MTNWDPALTQQVLTAEIAKNHKIDVIVSDFGPSLVGALPVIQEVRPVDPGAGDLGRQLAGLLLARNQEANPNFKLFTVATGNDNVRLAVQWAVAAGDGRHAAEGGDLQGADVRELGVG